MARKDILRIYDSAIFSFMKRKAEDSVPGHTVGCHMATPDRPFGFEVATDPETGDVDTDRVTSMLVTPQVTLTRVGINYDMRRNNTNVVRNLRTWDQQGKFSVMSEYPRPWNIEYQIDVYARLRNDAQNVLYYWLYHTQPMALLLLDFSYPWGKKKIYTTWSQIVDNSDVESGEKLRYYRYTIPFTVEAYMFEAFDGPSDIPHAWNDITAPTRRVRTVQKIRMEVREETSNTLITSITKPDVELP
jgi:hypothetical protein